MLDFFYYQGKFFFGQDMLYEKVVPILCRNNLESIMT